MGICIFGFLPVFALVCAIISIPFWFLGKWEGSVITEFIGIVIFTVGGSLFVMALYLQAVEGIVPTLESNETSSETWIVRERANALNQPLNSGQKIKGGWRILLFITGVVIGMLIFFGSILSLLTLVIATMLGDRTLLASDIVFLLLVFIIIMGISGAGLILLIFSIRKLKNLRASQ